MRFDKERESLLRLIINAGLEENLIEWLNSKGYRDFFGKLDNVPLELLMEFVNEMKLIDTEGGVEEIKMYYQKDVYIDEKEDYVKKRRLNQGGFK